MRVVGHALLGVGCFLFVGLGAEKARAANSPKVEGFELLGSVGYGFEYGVMLGLNGGYSWASGLRLGVDGQCGFGVLPCSTLTAGPSVAYDLVVSSWRFRGSFEAGVWFAYSPPELYVAPGLALIWQHGAFELGLGPRYVVAPIDNFQLTLMCGARF